MTTELLSIKDVYGILKTCRKLGVTRISYRGFEADLEDKVAHAGRRAVSKKSARSFDLMDEKTRETLRVVRKQEDLALMAIEDPLAYEKHLLSEDAAPEPNDEEIDI